MKAKGFIKQLFLILLVVGLIVCTVFVGIHFHNENLLETIQEQAISELSLNKGLYSENTIVLQNTNKAAANNAAEKLGAKLRITKDGNYATLTLPDGIIIEDVYKNDENRELLKSFSLDYYVKTSEIEDVPATREQPVARPQYNVSDTLYSMQTYLDYLNMQNVWSNYRGDGTTIAIIDTGIDTDHPEFTGKISEWSYNASEDKIVKDYVLENGEYDWSLIEDEQGHGTAVAGVISANMDGNGIVGIAPNVELLIIKVKCDEKGTILNGSDLVFGLYYAIEQDVDVINMSFGSTTNSFAAPARLAVDSDIICVAAAGNETTAQLTYPAADPNVIGVGALAENSWELAYYSNYGENTDIVAPGTVYTAKMGGTYQIINGTSFSSPIVAAVIALYKQQNKYCEFTNVKEMLYASSYDLGSIGQDYYFGYGALDVSAFLLDERGTVTFNYLTDEIEPTTQVFIRNHTLQNLPEPERNYCIFDGWYYDIYCTEELNWYADVWTDDLTLYANWVNEDDGLPYTYVTLEDDTIEIRSYTGHRRYITIPDYIEGKAVSSIGAYAFSNQTRLRVVNLPRYLKNIGEGAFYNCNNLISVSVPQGVKKIGAAAFYNNVRLYTVTFEESPSIEYIGDEAFAITALPSFEVPEKVYYLNGSAFFGATNIKSFTVAKNNLHFYAKNGVLFNATMSEIIAYPAGRANSVYAISDNVTKVGVNAFAYAKIKNLELNNVKTIDAGAFACSYLEKVVMPDTVTVMGSEAFKNNAYLSKVVLGRGLKTISEGAFIGAALLKSIVIPDSVEMIKGKAFARSGLTEVVFEENSSLLQIENGAFCSTWLLHITIPKSVIAIGDGAFSNDFFLNEVVFEEGSNLLSIGNSAFYNTASLATIVLPNSLETIYDYAFFNSGLIGEIIIPASVKIFGEGVFASCHNLTDITVDEQNAVYCSVNGVVYNKEKTALIEYPAGKELQTYTVLSDVTIIDNAAFYGSWKLNYINLPASLTEIHRYAFCDCINLQGISIPDNVVQISNYAFAYTKSLYTVYFTENSKLPRISIYSFAYSGIQYFRVPKNVSSLAQYAFYGCKNLSSITFAAGSKLGYISAYNFDGCDNLKYITFENGSALKNIQAHAFENATNLISIDFGDAKITNIDNYAFRYCFNLQSIDIPEGVTYIGRYAFYGASSLSRINVPTTVDFIGRYAFYTKDSVIEIYFALDTLPDNLQEHWDEGVKGYYVGVSDVITDGDWSYAKLNDGNVSIIKYNGNNTFVDLSTVDFGGNIVSIGGYAFYRSEVETVIIPDTVKTIQPYAFAYSKLNSITIPDSVNFIGKYAFYHSSVSEIVFAENSNVSRIEKYAFALTDYLKEITLPASVETLGSYVFYKSALEKITFADGINLTEIPQSAFERTCLSTVRIPDDITLINHNAFRDVTTLKTVEWGTSDFYLYSNVFYNTGIESLYIPENLTYIGEYSLVGLHHLENYVVSDNNEYYSSIDGVLYNKNADKLIAVPAGKTGTINIPDTVETLGFGAFENSLLSEITFAEDCNILTFGYRAFYNADNIVSITIPASVISIDYYAFAMCDNLTTVNFVEGNRLTGIYEGAFYGCKSLKKIIIPDSIVEISDYAFYGCSSLTKLPVSERSELKGIYDYAFAYAGIKELIIPDSVIDIGAYAFMGAKLKTVFIPDINKEQLIIGIGAFQECDDLEEITLPFTGASYMDYDIPWFSYIFGAGNVSASEAYVPTSLKKVYIAESPALSWDKIFGQALWNTTIAYFANLEEITLPEGMTDIGYNAFYGCDKLIEINISGTISDIKDYAFYGCSSLTNIILSDSITSIGSEAFSGCSSLTSITIPDNITSIGWRAFYGCIKLYRVANYSKIALVFGSDENDWLAFYAKEIVDVNGDITYCEQEANVEYVNTDNGFRFKKEGETYSLLDYIGAEETVVLPQNIFGKPYSIAKLPLLYGVKNVIIPDSVTAIEQRAFAYCPSLTTIFIGSGVLNIGEDAFYECLALKSITVSEDNANYSSQDGILYNKSKTEFIFIPLAIEGNIVIPDSITGGLSFRDRKGLTGVKLPEQLTVIGYYTFSGCDNLENVIIPKNVNTIYTSAFEGCTHLNIVIDAENKFFTEINGVIYDKDIKQIVFIPESITEIIIPKTVTYCSFADNKNIGSVSFEKGSGITYLWDWTFSGCSNLESVILPDSIEEIGQYAFYGCSSLINVVLPETLKTIGVRAFGKCSSITDIELPDSLTQIGGGAFAGCGSLISIKIPDGVSQINGFTFDGCYSLIKISIGRNVSSVAWQDNFYDCPYLSFEIDENNDFFVEIGGIVYNKDQTEILFTPKTNIVDDFAFIEQNGEYTLIAYLGEEETVSLPTDINGESYKISHLSGIKNVIIPNGIIEINEEAFWGCSTLSGVVIPDSVKHIGNGAFFNCTALSEINIYNDFIDIANQAFMNTAFYNNPVNWQNGMLYCGNILIKVNETAKYVFLKDSTTSIAKDAFAGCYLLKHINVYGDNFGVYSQLTNLETLVIDEMPTEHYLHNYFGLNSSAVPLTLKNIVINDINYRISSSMFSGISNVKIFVNEYKENLMWDSDTPDWNNGNKVYYKGEWNEITFYNADESIRSIDYYTTSQVIRQPFIKDVINGEYADKFIGFDIDGDGVADVIPATTSTGFEAKAIVKTVKTQISVNFINGDKIVSYAVYNYGDEMVSPITPTKKGYDFVCWSGFTEGMTATENADFYAVWQHMGGGHDYLHTIVPATCDSEGYDLYTCSACGDSYYENFVSATGHSFGDWIVDTEAACRTEGARHRICASCGACEDEVIEAHGHNYAGVITKVATCETEGETTYTCSHCGDKIIVKTSVTDHNYVKVKTSKFFLQWLAEHLLNVFFGYEGNEGYYYKCTECGHIRTSSESFGVKAASVLDVHEHILGDWQVVREQTCQEDGVLGRYCSVCNELVDAKPINACGHDYSIITVVSPTCEEDGYTLHTCSRCGDNYKTDIVTKLGHDLVHHEAKTATCTETGWNAYDTCTRCEYTTYEELPALGHNYEAVITAPTCTEQGYTTYTCAKCGDCYIADYVEAFGHTPSDWITTIEPTCTAKGSKHKICTVCGVELDVAEIEALGHDLVHHDAKSATCTETGWNAYDTCSRCDYTTYEEIPAKGHTPSDWITTIEPTCTAKGSKHKICTVCGVELEVAEIEALGHDHQAVVTAPTCLEGGYTTHTCSRCGDSYVDSQTDALGHNFGEWTVTKPAEQGVKGEEQRTCSRCGDIETREIPALPYVPSTNGDGEKVYNEVVTEEAKDVTELFKQAKEEESTVEIKATTEDSKEFTIIFDSSAVEALGNANVTISAKVSTKNLTVENAELVLEVTVSGATFENGKATVAIPFDKEAPQGKVGKVYYIDEQGNKTDMNATFENGKVVFTTNHFSTYAVMFEDVPATGLSGGAIAGIVIGSLFGLLLISCAVLFVLIKKGIIKLCKKD